MIKKMIISIIGVIVGLIIIGLLIGMIISAPVYKGHKSDHFNGKTFTNIGDVKSKGFLDVIKWMIGRDQKEWRKIDVNVDNNVPPEYAPSDSVIITYINHSTFLIQINGLNILTDPVWSKRVSPFSFAGPERQRPAGVKLENLPKIDLILLSHNHYDHMDISTLQELTKTHKPAILVPLGNKQFLEQKNIPLSQDVDWWDEISIKNSVSITCVPAQHFSGRGIMDRDATLWGGFIVEASGKTLYYAGDTGYGPFFKDISDKFPEIDLGIIPIGAYKPKWFMSPIHTSPEDAVKIHKEMNIRRSIACHFGTFPLADDGMDDPINDLKSALQSAKVSADDFLILEEGKSWVMK